MIIIISYRYVTVQVHLMMKYINIACIKMGTIYIDG